MRKLIIILFITLLGNVIVDGIQKPIHDGIPKEYFAQTVEAKKLPKTSLKKLDTEIAATPDKYKKKVAVAAPKPSSGDCEAYIAQAGIQDVANAREMIRRENNACDAQRYNMQGSDACGIAQELPCGKSGCGMPPNADGACQVKWMNQYVMDRYGSWGAAIQFHNINNWY